MTGSSPSSPARKGAASSCLVLNRVPEPNLEAHNAALAGDIPELDRLLNEDKTRLNQPGTQYGQTLLHSAVMRDQVQTARFLCMKGARVNHADVNGNTPLHFVSKRGEMYDLLITFGAQMVPNKDGEIAGSFAKPKGPQVITFPKQPSAASAFVSRLTKRGAGSAAEPESAQGASAAR